MVRKANAARTVRVSATAGMRAARSPMFKVPVITYSRPMPIKMNVAPIVPMIRY